ncbi:MAG: LPS assembly protein LptD [Acidobacteriota bacterium]|nr:LPS assembly protein LptD [Acidobacteriota bacterium]
MRIITLAVLSHLLLAVPAFTSQLPAPSPAVAAQPVSTAPGQDVVIRANQQSRQGDAQHPVYELDGDVEIAFQDYILRAEHVVYHEDTGASEATGRVTFDGGPHDAHLVAGHASYNVKEETGTFYDVTGTFGAVVRGNAVVLTTSNPFLITGRVVRKVDRNRYIVEHGSITSCAEPKPMWTFNAEKIDLVAGDDAKLYHSNFRLLRIPILYFPYAKTPASQMSRASGFLLPVVGESTTKGFIFGDSFFWAINRSNDLTVGAEYLSERGWSQTMQFRSRPSENSSLEVHYFGVMDRGVNVTNEINGVDQTVHQKQGGEEATMAGVNSHGNWREAGSIDYLSSFLFRLAFSPTYTQAVNSEVRSNAFVSHNLDGFSLNLDTERYQNFYQNPNNTGYWEQIKILHVPSVELNSLERPVDHSPLLWSLDASSGGVQRSEPGFVTANVVGRLDVHPSVALPLRWKGWDLRPEVGVHDTLYTQHLSYTSSSAVGSATGTGLNRRSLEAEIELRPPVLEKVFDREIFGRKLKHVIQPIITYRATTGIDNFAQVLRFDAMDIRSDTNELEYNFVQRIYGRRRPTAHEPGCETTDGAPRVNTAKLPQFYVPGVSAVAPKCEDEGNTTRELVTWEVKQKYFLDQTFGGALVSGRSNVLSNTIDLTGIAFLDRARPWSPVVSKLRVMTSANTDVQWQLDYDSLRGRMNASTAFVEYRWREYFLGGSQAFMRVPAASVTVIYPKEPLVFNQYRMLVGYGHPNKRGFSGGGSIGYDQNLNFLQYAAVQTSYNTDCCGLSFEYRHTNLPGINVENQYRFALTLANFGTFGNMRRQEKLY